jgi:hypothetical protein
MKKSSTRAGVPASTLIDARIDELGDWRGALLGRLRGLIKAADPEVVEEWKWGIPVWSHAGIVCTGEVYKAVVKTTFAKGASLADPKKLFNSSLAGNTRRAIDFGEGEPIDEDAFKGLVRAAVVANQTKLPAAKPKAAATKKAKRPAPAKKKPAPATKKKARKRS